jgi:hypothetical protein
LFQLVALAQTFVALLGGTFLRFHRHCRKFAVSVGVMSHSFQCLILFFLSFLRGGVYGKFPVNLQMKLRLLHFCFE